MLTTNVELIGKVIFAKGRVWTVYSTTDQGVFCYQGIKSYLTFEFKGYAMKSRNTSYFPISAATNNFIEGEEIDKHLKQMESEDKKELTRKKAIDFFTHLTGHTKSFVSKNIEERHNGFMFTTGRICYDLWKSEGALSLSHNLNGGYTETTYFDFITFDHHDVLNEKSRDAYKQEVIENYKLAL